MTIIFGFDGLVLFGGAENVRKKKDTSMKEKLQVVGRVWVGCVVLVC